MDALDTWTTAPAGAKFNAPISNWAVDQPRPSAQRRDVIRLEERYSGPSSNDALVSDVICEFIAELN